MKKTKIISIILMIAIILSAFSLSTRVIGTEPDAGEPGDNARTSAEGEPVVTSETEGEPENTTDDGHNHTEDEDFVVHSGDLYIASADREYIMDQNVDGNVYIFGKNVKVTGSINGSLFVCASGNLTIEKDAYIACHVFAFADTIQMSGIAFDLYAVGVNVTVNEGSIISRDMRVVGNNIYLAGATGRDVLAYGQKITAPEEAEKLIIYGSLKYQSNSEIANLDKASITGEVSYNQLKGKEDKADTVIEYVLSAIGTIVFDIVMYLLFIFFAPKFVEKSKEYVSTKGLLAFAVGVAFVILVPIISLLLFMTGVGAGLGFFALFLYATLLMLNAFAVTLATTEFIAPKLKMGEDKFKKGLLLIPISLVIWGLRKIPFIGSWIATIVFICGVGILIFYQFDKRRKPKEEK